MGAFHELAAVRFKLLAALPTVTGAAAAILQSQRAEIAASISAFGLLVTFGIILAAISRNSQISATPCKQCARSLEGAGYESVNGRFRFGGPLLYLPPRSLRFFGIRPWRDRGLAIVYAASLAAWSYGWQPPCCRPDNCSLQRLECRLRFSWRRCIGFRPSRKQPIVWRPAAARSAFAGVLRFWRSVIRSLAGRTRAEAPDSVGERHGARAGGRRHHEPSAGLPHARLYTFRSRLTGWPPPDRPRHATARGG